MPAGGEAHLERQTVRQRDRETERQRDRETGRQADKRSRKKSELTWKATPLCAVTAGAWKLSTKPGLSKRVRAAETAST